MAPSTDTPRMKYEVFLSFRGPDTRLGFTSCLYEYLVDQGIRVFKDDEELTVGEKIEELLKALDDSQIYIPIFSRDFASSAWCLEELARMSDRTLESDGKKEIIPIFLDVKTEDVKGSTGLYSNALSKLEKVRVKYGDEEEKLKYDPDKVKRWRVAVREVAARFGWEVEGKEQGIIMRTIARELLLKLQVKNRALPPNLVERDDEEDIKELLEVDSADHVRFVIIHGAGGIGKTTLASIIFNRFQSKFNCSCFLEVVPCHDLLYMQKQLLSKILGSTSAQEIHDTNDGINRIRRGLSNKKVLLVVDNVDEENQLTNLAGSCDWFGRGSRVIVTGRDISKMKNEDMPRRPSSYLPYQVKEMPFDRAIQLFNKHALGSDTPPKDFPDISAKVVSSIGGLPLILEVVGSLFAGVSRSEWEKTLEDYIGVPHKDVRKTLMISIDKLNPEEKNIFLDIACFCIGEDQIHACYMWDDCGYSCPRRVIRVLCLMSLIKINKNNKFWMHDELRDLGRCLVKEMNVEDPGKRRWVWINEKTSRILGRKKEKPDVRALSLGINHDFTPEELAHFPELKFLGGERMHFLERMNFLGGKGMNFVGDFKDSLLELRWLSWHHCPLNLSATNLFPVNLVVLNLSGNNITHEWVGWSQIKNAKKLKVLDLTECRKLTQTPDLSGLDNLEILILAWCKELSTIDSSIGGLKRLVSLNIEECDSLQGLPEEIGSLEQLSELIMPTDIGMARRFKLPETLGNLKLLEKFQGHCGISQIPDSIGRLTNLTHLILRQCKYLNELPDFIGELKSLIELDLEFSAIREIPNSIGNLKMLKVLSVGGTRLKTIPSAIGQVEMLQELHAAGLFSLNCEFPRELGCLTHLRILNFCGTRISALPTTIKGCSSLQTLMLTGQRELPVLPELPSNLKCLLISSEKFPFLPDLSNLVHLDHLEVWRNMLHKSPGLFSASSLDTEEVISPWEDAQSIDRLPPSLSILRLGWIPQLPKFSVLKSLSFLYIYGCLMQHFPDLGCLEWLRELEIWQCKFLESTPDLSRLKSLQNLQLIDLPKLVEIPGLGELESLKFLEIAGCNAIEQLPNLSKLKNLRHLELEGCEKMRGVEGLKELNSLKKVGIRHCVSMKRPDVPAFTKLETCWMEVPEDSMSSLRRSLRLIPTEGRHLPTEGRHVGGSSIIFLHNVRKRPKWN